MYSPILYFIFHGDHEEARAHRRETAMIAQRAAHPSRRLRRHRHSTSIYCWSAVER